MNKKNIQKKKAREAKRRQIAAGREDYSVKVIRHLIRSLNAGNEMLERSSAHASVLVIGTAVTVEDLSGGTGNILLAAGKLIRVVSELTNTPEEAAAAMAVALYRRYYPKEGKAEHE